MRKAFEVVLARCVILIARLLSRRGVLLIKYFDVFGHQAWNSEYIARKYFYKFNKWPLLIGFQRSQFLPNHALYSHHKSNGLILVSSKSIFAKLYRIASAYQKESDLNAVGEDNFGTNWFSQPTMAQLHCDRTSECIRQVAYPLSPSQEQDAIQVLETYDLAPFQYYCFFDRNLGYKYEISDSKETDILKAGRFDHARNTALESYYPAAREMKAMGIAAVRLGKNPETRGDGNTIIDYASTRQENSDFEDLALMNYCKFYLGPNSGIWLLARAFNRPVCLINVFPWPWINVPMSNDCLVVPKKIWHKLDKRFLTIQEMVELEKKFFWKDLYRGVLFDELSIELIDNTPEETKAVTIEMYERLNNTWTGADYPLAKILTQSNVGKNSKAKLAASFVEQNKDIFTF